MARPIIHALSTGEYHDSASARSGAPADRLPRDPLASPEIKCNVAGSFARARTPAEAVELASGRVVRGVR